MEAIDVYACPRSRPSTSPMICLHGDQATYTWKQSMATHACKVPSHEACQPGILPSRLVGASDHHQFLQTALARTDCHLHRDCYAGFDASAHILQMTGGGSGVIVFCLKRHNPFFGRAPISRVRDCSHKYSFCAACAPHVGFSLQALGKNEAVL